jgi:DNA topoisomerase-3
VESPAQVLFAEKIAQEKGIVMPDRATASSTGMSAWIDSNQSAKPEKGRRKTADKRPLSAAAKSMAPTKRARKPKTVSASFNAPPAPARQNSGSNTPLRIPYGNKEVAQKLGARYGAGGWYAPPGVDLTAFGEQGWL